MPAETQSIDIYSQTLPYSLEAEQSVLGALLLDETFKPAFFLGMLLISIDVVLSTLETRRLSRLEAGN